MLFMAWIRISAKLSTEGDILSRVLHRSRKRPVEDGARDFEQVGNALPVAFAFVDEVAGVFQLFRRKLALAPEFHASALGGSHSGAGAFADNAALKFG